MRPGWQRGLIRDDRRRSDEMHRGRDLARKFEARHRQLHIGVGEFDDRMEKRDRYRAHTPRAQHLVQTTYRWLINSFVIFPCDGRVLMTLLFCRRWRQAEEVRSAIFARQMQKRCAAESDGWPLRARSEQHGQYAKEHVIANDHVGLILPQCLLQALMLRR